MLRPSAIATLAGCLLLVASACSEDGTPDESPAAPSTPATSASASASPPPAEPQPLLPDLTTLPATGLIIEGSGDARVLRFGTTLANTGTGPLETVPDRATPCPPEQRSFVQVIRVDGDGDGRYDPLADTDTETRDGACVVFHPTHDHWHIDGSSRYELLDPAGARVVWTRKVSFCLRDSGTLPRTPDGDPVYEDCARDRLQGISPGWGDLYDRDLDGQTLALPAGMADGAYCLQMTADPFDYFLEADESDNASRTPLRITGTTVRVGGGGCG